VHQVPVFLHNFGGACNAKHAVGGACSLVQVWCKHVLTDLEFVRDLILVINDLHVGHAHIITLVAVAEELSERLVVDIVTPLLRARVVLDCGLVDERFVVLFGHVCLPVVRIDRHHVVH